MQSDACRGVKSCTDVTAHQSLRTRIATEIWWRVAGHNDLDDAFAGKPFGDRFGRADFFFLATDLGRPDAAGKCAWDWTTLLHQDLHSGAAVFPIASTLPEASQQIRNANTQKCRAEMQSRKDTQHLSPQDTRVSWKDHAYNWFLESPPGDLFMRRVKDCAWQFLNGVRVLRGC